MDSGVRSASVRSRKIIVYEARLYGQEKGPLLVKNPPKWNSYSAIVEGMFHSGGRETRFHVQVVGISPVLAEVTTIDLKGFVAYC